MHYMKRVLGIGAGFLIAAASLFLVGCGVLYLDGTYGVELDMQGFEADSYTISFWMKGNDYAQYSS